MNLAWKFKTALLLMVLLSAAGFGLAQNGFGGGTGVWVVALLVLAALALLLALWLESAVLGPVVHLQQVIQQMYADGDLTRRAAVRADDELGAAAKAFNNLIGSLQTIIGKVFFNSLQVEKAARQLISEANRVADGSSRQVSAAQGTTEAMGQLTENMNAISRHAHDAAAISQSAAELSQDGAGVANNASREMANIAHSVTESAQVIQALGERSKAISGIVQTIREIADQTNLLALNAAIEAARAGEQGRGFAVVADEVRKLAERTSQATGEIGRVIAAIQSETESAISAIDAGSNQARSGADLAHQAADSLERIHEGARKTMETVDAIASSIEEQSAAGEDIAGHVRSIMEMTQSNTSAAQQTLREAQQLDSLATNLKEIGDVFRLGAAGQQALATHGQMPAMVQRAAQQIGELLERNVESGRLGMDDLFDSRYQPVPNTKPQKFKTRYDDLFDQIMPQIQEALVEQNKWLVYAICCDRRGYVPTHNKRFSKPLTGNYDTDFVNNRTKRMFDDPVGRRCGEHEQVFLLQTYRRDTGEIMHDISAPIYVRGQHWGGFRIGYRTET
ncbi:MAG: hypothetical protein RIR00_1176 [Pseudomonadota bacterium]|jgi:methyl-accepting chemotaxis protein